jgi:hypothetical protein
MQLGWIGRDIRHSHFKDSRVRVKDLKNGINVSGNSVQLTSYMDSGSIRAMRGKVGMICCVAGLIFAGNLSILKKALQRANRKSERLKKC